MISHVETSLEGIKLAMACPAGSMLAGTDYVSASIHSVGPAIGLGLAGLALVVLLWALLEPYLLRIRLTHMGLPARDPRTQRTQSGDSPAVTASRPAMPPADGRQSRLVVNPGAAAAASHTAGNLPEASSHTAGGPADDSSLQVILISDLHTEWLRISPARLGAALARAMASHPADVIVFAGDVTHSLQQLTRSRAWLRAIHAAARSHGIPLLAVPGNHDRPETLALLREEGFTVLQNNIAWVYSQQGHPWAFAGLEDLRKGAPDLAGTLDRAAKDKRRPLVPASRRVVVAHNPDSLLTQTASQAAFLLAGHFHGGQIWMPFHLEFFLLRREQIGRLGYHRGYFIWHQIHCYITQGLGCVLFPLRLFSRPEIAVLTLHAPDLAKQSRTTA